MTTIRSRLTKCGAFVRGAMMGLVIGMGAVPTLARGEESPPVDSAQSASLTLARTIEETQEYLFQVLFSAAAPSAAVEFDLAWADGGRSIAEAVAPGGETISIGVMDRGSVNPMQPEVIGALTPEQASQLEAMSLGVELCFGTIAVSDAALVAMFMCFTGIDEKGSAFERAVVLQVTDYDPSVVFLLAGALEEPEVIAVGGGDAGASGERQAAGGPWGYWRCVGHVLKCEALFVGCLASGVATVTGCALACGATLTLGCVACVLLGIGGTVALCDSAISCIGIGRARGCIP
jgi:hypothetical protein